ncbi:sulfiredoxin [Xylona heveae TC161]|uniref:Sulfiredoxin n=1 Tax=Xylona heveae (strain CBS 132557 / TC161) TaxID=1328760 RepID=A0A165HWY3_XYLHT|nr:sulfiredoxin [Xylona heveae TC161]KZF24041.1 sulfiredoxin [Xylona heveae TC161]
MSIQSAHVGITWIPLKDILRPIQPVLDESKVESMVCTLANPAEKYTYRPDADESETPLPAVDVLQYRRPEAEGRPERIFNFAMGSCHRLSAYTRSETEKVPAKVHKVTLSQLKMYLGASVERIVSE